MPHQSAGNFGLHGRWEAAQAFPASPLVAQKAGAALWSRPLLSRVGTVGQGRIAEHGRGEGRHAATENRPRGSVAASGSGDGVIRRPSAVGKGYACHPGCSDPFEKKDWGPVFPVQRRTAPLEELVSKRPNTHKYRQQSAVITLCSWGSPHHTWMILCNTHILPAWKVQTFCRAVEPRVTYVRSRAVSHAQARYWCPQGPRCGILIRLAAGARHH